jgi:hypothetical protein
MVNSGPGMPLVSCQPNGEAVDPGTVAGLLNRVRPSAGGKGVVWLGLSTGRG